MLINNIITIIISESNVGIVILKNRRSNFIPVKIKIHPTPYFIPLNILLSLDKIK